MGKRGTSAFRKRDVARAIGAARDAGVAPAVVEVETRDGVIIRVFSGDAAAATEDPGAKEWSKAIEELKTTPKRGDK